MGEFPPIWAINASQKSLHLAAENNAAGVAKLPTEGDAEVNAKTKSGLMP